MTNKIGDGIKNEETGLIHGEVWDIKRKVSGADVFLYAVLGHETVCGVWGEEYGHRWAADQEGSREPDRGTGYEE